MLRIIFFPYKIIKPEIVIKMAGGLGDQMARYCLALTIQKIANLPICFDLSFYKKWGKDDFGVEERDFLLDKIFPTISIKEASELKISLYRKYAAQTPKYNKLIKRQAMYIENIHRYHDHFLYKDCRTDCFEFSLDLNNYKKEILSCILNTCGIALHIRRGDILVYEQKGVKYFLPTVNYVFNAINYIVSKINLEKIVIFVFSNDIAWCKENIVSRYDIIFVENNGGVFAPAEDMFLMSQCHHFILSKSAFGYWAARLAKSDDKIILIPSEADRDIPQEFDSAKY